MAIPKGAASATPVEPSLVARLTGAVQYAVTGKLPVWMSPQEPMVPVVQGPESASVLGRRFDFPIGYNQRVTPRQEEAVSFTQMRGLADGYDLMRLVIETRKDQMEKLKWSIKPKDEKATPDSRCAQVHDFLQLPDKEHGWGTWLRMILEDLFVIDAPTIYIRKTRGGQLYALEPLDGSTVKRVIDEFGRTPMLPAPAYQQILKGVPVINYNREELIYLPRNIRTHKVYGYSPVEQVITTVNIAIRRQLFQLNYYTEGNIPEALMSTPAEWQPDQVAQFQAYWDNFMEGDMAARRHMKFVPDGLKMIETKAPILKDEYDEWLARVICYAFSISPQAFTKQMNRATAETAQEAALEEGLQPVMQWVKNLIDVVIVSQFGFTDIEFDWSVEKSIDPTAQAKIIDTKVRNGTLTINEARALDGNEPVDGGDEPIIITATGAVALKDALEQSANAPQVQLQAAQMHADAAAQANNTPAGNPGTKKPVAGKKPPANAEKIEKKKSIDRDRASIVKLRSGLQAQVLDFFKDQAPKIAKQVVKAKIELFGKSEAEKDPHHVVDSLDFSEWSDLPATVGPALIKIAQDGATEALAQIGVEFDESALDQVNQSALDWAEGRAAQWVGMSKDENGDMVPNQNESWQIDESTRSMLQGDVTKAIAEGWSNDELAKAITENYAFSDARAQTIARTETAFADVQGNLLAYKQSGVVSGKQWLADADCCDDCQELDGEEVDLDESFSDGSDGPPAHVNCRCDFLPILNDQNSEDDA